MNGTQRCVRAATSASIWARAQTVGEDMAKTAQQNKDAISMSPDCLSLAHWDDTKVKMVDGSKRTRRPAPRAPRS